MMSTRKAFSKVLNNKSVSQFTGKVGRLIVKYPFWILVVGSLGIHTGFMLLTPNPLKKTEAPREVIVPTLNLPPKQLTTIPKKNNKSIFDDLFVKPANKLDIPNDNSSRSSDLALFDRVENSPLVDRNSLMDNSLFLEDSQNLQPTDGKKPPTAAPKTQVSTSSRTTDAGKIDNTTKNPSNNLKPELQGNGLKSEPSPNTDSKNNQIGKNSKTTSNAPKTVKPDQNEKISIDLTNSMFIDPEVLAKGTIDTTRIASRDLLINEDTREKGVEWIPPKVKNVSGKSGTVTYAWLVAPDGKVDKKFVEFKKTVDQELVDIVRETVKDYKFKPSQGNKYRLVSAIYVFP